MNALQDKIILVTGASGGIGQEASSMFAAAGAKVMMLDLNEQALTEAAATISAAGGVVEPISINITDEHQVSQVIDGIVERHGRLDGAFNNAGIEQSNKPLHELPRASWDKVIAVDLTGAFLCMKHEIRVMLKTGGGSIVNTASGLGVVAAEAASDYIAAKHGVIGLTKAAAIDYAKLGIRVNAILPGIVETPMIMRLSGEPAFTSQFEAMRERHPMGRFAQPAEIAAGVLWLLSDASSFVTGASMPIDGGFLAV
ncbi:SDR family NAD(P)-dependent oxidoreductase [Rhizobium sp. P28RR-XV]|uniref:SDR family NAD(P)-dependent oxidoreductase n=1 Tax=Rhizobium sp. P28RR-XV TaxID=2726737 RepID=UPI00145731D5|nr:SDR family oxidoreductase [Rhizobium sp. P28RR-XV]NLR88427.1 SDR family oxidoreductase [Rhizobium sp. P28RR-XV]